MALDVDALKTRAMGAVKQFSPAQLVIAGLLSVVTLVGGFSFYTWVSAPSYTVLYSGLSAKDAASVEAKLQSSGVPFKLTSGGTTIMVPKDKVDAERVAISAAGIVKGGTTGYELLDKQSLTTSSFTQQIDLQRAMEGELARSLETMDGINNAQVHLVLPQERLFSDNQSPARASVLLDTNGLLSHSEVQSVIQLVSSSVQDLDPSAVTVTDSNGNLLSSTSDDAASTQLQQTQAYEDTVSAQAQSMLDQLVGIGHSVVRVSANMDYSKHTTDTTAVGKSTPTSVTTSTETYTGTGASTASGNLSASTTTSSTTTGGAGDKYNKKSSTTTYGVTQSTDHAETNGGGVLNKLSVAVAVDSSIKNLPSTTQLTQLVAAAVGLNPSRGDTIVVTPAAFNTTPTPTVAPKKTGGPIPTGMLSMASTGVAVLMLLVITLLVARSVRRPKITEIEVPAGVNAAPPGSIPRQVSYSISEPGMPSAPDLIGIVEQSPDDVATLLRGWLADTGANR